MVKGLVVAGGRSWESAGRGCPPRAESNPFPGSFQVRRSAYPLCCRVQICINPPLFLLCALRPEE
jgi:hypothetical protein